MDSDPRDAEQNAHEYFILNFETIWTTIETELPLLIRQVEAVLQPKP